METIFLKLLNMSISAGWLILAVILLRFVLKCAPKWIRCVLWGMVALRLICPFSLESHFSLIPSAETIPSEILYAEEPMIHSGVSILNNAVNPVISGSLAPNVGDSVNPVQVLTTVATMVWLVGMIVMGIYVFISYICLRRKVAVSMPITGNIYLCDYVDTPFILGVLRPRIYLPSTLGQKQIPYVISHERAHLKRRDHLWKPLGYMLLTLYWFNPMVWVAYVLLCRDIELACDEKVIRELGEMDKKSYSDALLECSVSRQMITACPLAFGEVGVKERVKTVLNYKRPAFWILVVAMVACITVAVCFLTNPEKEDQSGWSPIGQSYAVEATVYTYGKEMILSVIYPIDFAGYRFSAECEMLARKGMGLDQSSEEWVSLGKLQEMKLTKKNFDEYFKEWEGLPGYPFDFSAEEYRQGNAKAWQVLQTGEDVMSYYLLQQKSGEVYLVCWYCDGERENDPASDDSVVRWMFKLAQVKEDTTEPAVPGGTSGLNELGQEQLDLPEPSEESEVAEPKVDTEGVDTLEQAIHDAIMGTDAERVVNGLLFPCESHVILETETLCGVPKADGTGGGEYITVYAMVLEQDYSFGYPNGEIIEGLGAHGPVAITFKVQGGEYILEEYWRPRDGSYYVTDIHDKFPDDIEEEALDTQKYILVQMQDCYNQAVQFGGTDTDAVVEELIETILFHPKEESGIQPYIAAHSLEYRELIYYGMHTLVYCCDRFEEGNQTDLRGSLMAAVSRDIVEGYGWQPIDESWHENAQKWYDNYAKKEIFSRLELVRETWMGDWGVTLSAGNVTANGLDLTIQQSGGVPTGDLQYGSEYQLLVRKNGIWNKVPTIKDNYGWTAEAYHIPMEESVSFAVYWTWLYGTLPPGEYRLIKEIIDFRGSGDFDIQDYYVDFEIS